MISKIFSLGVNVISLLFTACLILYILYYRIFLNTQKTDMDLENIQENLLFFQTLLFFSVLLTLGYIIIIFVKIKIKGDTVGFFTLKFIKLSKLMEKYDPFYHAYSFIFNKVDTEYTVHLVDFTKLLLEFSDKKNLIIIVLSVTLPRILILCVLLFDIFIMQTLHYYFYSLILIVIPLIFRFLVFIFTDLSKKLLPEFEKFIDIGKSEPFDYELNFGKTETFANNQKSTNKPKFSTIPIKLKPEYKKEFTLDNVLHNFYYPMLFLDGHMKYEILPLYSKISSYTKLMYYGIQSCCWLYIITTI